MSKQIGSFVPGNNMQLKKKIHTFTYCHHLL